ncbi:hypothetical protein JCM8097_003130 [Rhodosporidiobolus ruineniae]
MEHHHQHSERALHAQLRRQFVAAPVGADSSSNSPSSAQLAASSAAAQTTTPAQATTSEAPVVDSTTSDAPASPSSSSSSSSLVPEQSSSTTTTTAAPVQSTTTTTATTTSSTTTPPVEESSALSLSFFPSTWRISIRAEDATTTTTSTTTTSSSSSSSATTSAPSAFTTVVVVSGVSSSLTSTLSSSAALASSTSGSSSGGIGTGGVVGIVIGAIAGIVVLATAAVWVFKYFNRERDDDDQISPFDKDDFRRQSVMLDDVDDGYARSLTGHFAGPPGGGGGGFHSPQMSEHSLHSMHGELGMMGAGAGMLGRSNTVLSAGHNGGPALPGVARNGTLHAPRPPTMLQHHYAAHQHQQQYGAGPGAMPSFQPGQIVAPPPAAYGAAPRGFPDVYAGAGPSPYAAAGLYPSTAAGVGANLDRSLTSASAGPWQGQGGAQGLHRANSAASAYSQYSDGAGHSGTGGGGFVPAALRPGGSTHGHGLGMLTEEGEAERAPSPRGPFPPHLLQPQHPPSRSGTPTNANVQQVFSSAAAPGAGHEREKSLDAFGGRSPRRETFELDEDAHHVAHGGGGKRLSVRNGGLDAFGEDEDPYGGMH